MINIYILSLILLISSINTYFCVYTPVANPATTYITNSPCSSAY